MSLNLSPISKYIHAIVLTVDGAAATVAAIDPSFLPPKYAALLIGVQHFALILRREGPLVDTTATKGVSSLEEFIKEMQSTADVPPGLIAQVAAESPPVA